MESQPQNHEFRNNPENFHPWVYMRQRKFEPNGFIGDNSIFKILVNREKYKRRHNRWKCETYG